METQVTEVLSVREETPTVRSIRLRRPPDAKRAWWAKMKLMLEKLDGPCRIPDGVDSAWVIEGEALGYFRRIRHPAGHWVLHRA